jgi:outer membrane protein OmpA-like peptidoglycan-associated protein
MKRGVLVLFIAAVGILYLSLKSKLLEDDVPREKLSSTINSDFQEVRPLISPDGKTLYFSRRNHPENTGGPKDYQDIWVSHFEDGQWTTPTKLSEPINNKKANTLCAISSDGGYMMLFDSYKQVKKTPLAHAFDSPAGWGAPGGIEIDNFINRSSYYDFYYEEHSEVLLSAIDDGSGQGEQDLHVSFKQKDGSYSKPKNLGKMINTDQDDFAPFLAADGKTLYFASFGGDGFGGSDFYVSYRLDESWNRWTEPKNLGSGINSRDDENYLSITADFRYIYFESYPTGAEQKDIYRAILPGQFHPEHLAPAPEQPDMIASAEAREPTAPELVNEHSDNEQHEQILETTWEETHSTTDQVATQTYLKSEPYSSVEDVQPRTSQLTMDSLGTRQYLEDGQLKSKVLRNHYFPLGSYQLSTPAKTLLVEVSEMLKQNPALEAQLEGHTDSWGSHEINLRLSYLRAQAAAHYLIDHGISGNRLQVIGTGSQSPLASNDDEKEGRELNRRVEVTLMGPTTSLSFIIR